MSRAPNRESLRARVLAYFAENPSAMLTRQEIRERFGASTKALDEVARRLKRDGHIKALFGPNRVVYYCLVSAPPLPKPKPANKPIREWPSSSSYVPPRPIAISVFEWRP